MIGMLYNVASAHITEPKLPGPFFDLSRTPTDPLYGPWWGEKPKDDETYTKEEILAEIEKLANGDEMLYNKMALISHCESNFQNVQSNIYKDGKREESYGVVQIHLPSHPYITKEQALDVKFSLRFLRDELLVGNEWKWYGYDSVRNSCKQ